MAPPSAARGFDGGAGRAPSALSTDFLNRYGEALMLLEMLPMDRDILADLEAWRPAGYREHFDGSALRCAAGALSAFDRLDRRQVRAFEALCAAMDRLIATVVAVIVEQDARDDPAPVVEVATAALRRLLERATRFINTGGEVSAEDEAGLAQDDIDALFAA